MDIKEAAEQAIIKEAELGSKIESAVKKVLESDQGCRSSLYQVPEDSDCLKDIIEITNFTTDYIKGIFKNLAHEDFEAQRKALELCVAAANMLEKYRSIRLNVEVGGKFKYETLPTPPMHIKQSRQEI